MLKDKGKHYIATVTHVVQDQICRLAFRQRACIHPRANDVAGSSCMAVRKPLHCSLRNDRVRDCGKPTVQARKDAQCHQTTRHNKTGTRLHRLSLPGW